VLRSIVGVLCVCMCCGVFGERVCVRVRVVFCCAVLFCVVLCDVCSVCVCVCCVLRAVCVVVCW